MIMVGLGNARAAVYSVSPQGSDAGPGTAARPFATLQKAADTAQAGDTVRVRRGLYREAVHLSRSGTAAAPIRFEADPPGAATLSGTDPVTGWGRRPGPAPIYQTAWNHLFSIDERDGKPVEQHPEDDRRWGRAEQTLMDGRLLLPALSLAELEHAWAKHAETPGPTLPPPLPHLGGPFAGMFYADTARKKLSVWLADGSSPAAHQMEAATRGQTFGVNPWENKNGVSFVQVRGFRFCGGASFPQRGAVCLYGAHNLLEDSVVENMAGGGVAVSGTMRRCIVRGCGHVGGGAGGAGFVNDRCLWEGNCWKPISRDWDAGGVKLTQTDSGVYQDCVFRRNGGPGLWLDIDVRHVRITRCVFWENEGSGLMIEISRRCRVDHCLSVRNGVGAVGLPGGWGAGGILLAESEDCLVASNTLADNKDGLTFREQGPRPLETPDGTLAYHNARNTVTRNVCVSSRGYPLGFWYDNGFFGRHPADEAKYPTEAAFAASLRATPALVFDPLRQGLMLDYNCYWSAPGKPLALYGVPWRVKHQEFVQRADWTRKTGFDAHSQAADPQFMDPDRGDYRLKLTSPARASGAGWANAPANVDTWQSAWLPSWR